ncbi:aldo/keto reductase [Halothermothrix orenii]|uniref:Aldo/keto reductase n=1 Tax=Halothermothrix orenii (strain H 168 / OCM 544 / DSM 9562) TaxID=373903 RepID=B8D1S7_HALOH|nr:aldo/keto reductase [Halothermothrix orenii]ACL69154.1 aldo/keto reductase [Halothermothrix orenii H 168]
MLKKRKLGTTGLEVSEIGFGCWQLGNTKDWRGATGEDAIRLVHKAIEMGCNFFDTAPNYAGGKSEELLGKALKGKRDKVIISSKFGHTPDGQTSFDPSLLKKSVEESLGRLETDYLDILLLHSPPVEVIKGSQGHYQIMEELKKEGKIRFYGASVDTGQQMLDVINNSNSSVIEILFNLFHQEPRRVFPRAGEEGVGLIVKVPLDSGWLTGKYNADSTFTGIRERWSREVIKRRASLVEMVKDIKDDNTSMVHEALKYILAYPQVSTVIPGVRTEEHLIENFKASERKLSDDRLRKYEDLYNKYIEGNELPW